jgi:branched-subunit amino acid ABC-type transport system permease component
MEIRPVPWWLFVLVLAAVGFMIALGWIVPEWLWRPLYDRSYGFVNPWFIAYTLLVVCGILLGVGRRRPAELGLAWRKLPAAALYTCVVWMSLQLVLAGWYLAF